MIYVDELRTYAQARTGLARRYNTAWCHMATDGDVEELHAFAEQIGLRRAWFQPHAGVPHYDLTPSRRTLAVQHGASDVAAVELVRRCSIRRAESGIRRREQEGRR